MSLDKKLTLLETRVEALVSASQRVQKQNKKLLSNESELVRKNDLAKSKIEEMIRKLRTLDK